MRWGWGWGWGGEEGGFWSGSENIKYQKIIAPVNMAVGRDIVIQAGCLTSNRFCYATILNPERCIVNTNRITVSYWLHYVLLCGVHVVSMWCLCGVYVVSMWCHVVSMWCLCGVSYRLFTLLLLIAKPLPISNSK